MQAVFFEEKFVNMMPRLGGRDYECLGVYFPETKKVIKINQTHTRLMEIDENGAAVFDSLVQIKEIKGGFMSSGLNFKLISLENLPDDHPLLVLASKIAELDLERDKLDQKYKELREQSLHLFPTVPK